MENFNLKFYLWILVFIAFDLFTLLISFIIQFTENYRCLMYALKVRSYNLSYINIFGIFAFRYYIVYYFYIC